MANIPVLVLLEDATQDLAAADLELLTLGRTIGPVTAVAFAQPTADVVAQLALFGVPEVLVLQVTQERFLTTVTAHALAEAVAHVGAGLVLTRATFANKEASALLALETGAGLIIDAAKVEVRADGSILGAKRVFAGSWDVEFTNQTPLSVLTVRANAVQPEEAPSPTTPRVSVLEIGSAERAVQVQLISRTVHTDADQNPSTEPNLADAPIVVAGGRGTFGDFEPVRELAHVLGAAVGATRDCVDEGWIEHDRQIGQTGVTIAPRLYIGAGISGAPHHRGGMQASEIIVAVNSDPECPIFEICDFAVVGDLAEVLPQAASALAEFKAAKGTQTS